ncbi:HNH endonuclease family protein [Actinopolymorpha sp. B17G11]|uniref:HNH endonuclease family protein n=1 Tax=unclassified Actinopolymorpha TaxID=2627063 RepID=UPI0032D926C9
MSRWRSGPDPARRSPRKRPAILAVVLASVALVLSTQQSAVAYPPTPPSGGEAASMLAALTVAPEGSSDGYDRDLFPHWINQSGSCDTREVVLQRDGTGVAVDSSCQPTSGQWYSVYDATWVTDSSDVDIDHIVALAEAWRSGASGWTTTRRQEFANNLSIAQLIAVSASSNASKSDKDPAEWIPPNQNTWCIYAREWIWVKSSYGLTVDSAEKQALQSLLGSC